MNRNIDEEKFLYNFLYSDVNFINEYINSKCKKDYNITILELIDYILYSEFNPYLEEKYLDITWLYCKENKKIYNLDDIFEVYQDNLKEEN